MSQINNLQLYMRDGCGYCAMVMRESQRLNIDMPLKNIWQDEAANQALLENTGRSIVPVLYYEDEDGNAHWMPESIDIIFFLRKHFEASLKA